MLSFLCLFVHRVLPAGVTELIELDLAFDKLFVLARPVVYALAGLAGEFDQLVL